VLVVEAGIRIDCFNARPSPGRVALAALVDHGEVRLVVPDRVLFEGLRGLRHERDHRQARALMEGLDDALLHDDRDFTAFQARRGRRAWRH